VIPVVDVMALFDALGACAYALYAAEGGNRVAAVEAYMEASAAAVGAFPEGSAEAGALNVILGVVGAQAAGQVTA
jgi:hypothetical protein